MGNAVIVGAIARGRRFKDPQIFRLVSLIP